MTTPWVVKPEGKRHYVVRWRDPESGRVRQRSTGQTRRRDAERVADEVAAEISAGTSQRKIHWREFCDRYKREGLSHCRKGTVAKWMTAKRHVSDKLNPVLLEDLTASRLSSFRRDLADTMAPATVDGVVRHLMVALRWAESLGLIRQAPRLPREKRGGRRNGMKGRPITLEEFERMIAATGAVVGEEHAESWKRMMWVGWYSGLRLGELLRLTWDDPDQLLVGAIDCDQPLLVIPAEFDKGGLHRQTPVPLDFARYLRATPEAERTGHVCNPTGPRGVTRNLQWVSARLSKIGEKAKVVVARKPKLKYASAHDWRRSFGDRWATRVVPAVLQQMMRHADVKTTMEFYVGHESRRLAASVWEFEGVAEQRDPVRDPSESQQNA